MTNFGSKYSTLIEQLKYGHRHMLSVFAFLTFTIVLLSSSVSFAGSSHSDHGSHNHSGHHGLLEVDANKVPEVSLEVRKDKVSGWNITVGTKNFTFSPESVNGPAVQNQGHAHLYVDGKKVGRLYGSHFHLADEPAGHFVVKVTLNADDHSVFALDGNAIQATKMVTPETH